MAWISPALTIFSKKLVFFQTRILLFLVEHYSTKTYIISYYLLPNSTTLKLCHQEYEYVTVQK